MDGQNDDMRSAVTVKMYKIVREYSCSQCSQYPFIAINVYFSLNKREIMCKISRTVYFKSGSCLAWSKTERRLQILYSVTQNLSIIKTLFTSKYQDFKANELGRDNDALRAHVSGGGGEIFRPCPDRHWSPNQPSVQRGPDLFTRGYRKCYMTLTTFKSDFHCADFHKPLIRLKKKL